jgi:hypothetical protein
VLGVPATAADNIRLSVVDPSVPSSSAVPGEIPAVVHLDPSLTLADAGIVQGVVLLAELTDDSWCTIM